ncbi:molecular chaperone [Actinoalloteichus sp. GBA129-24]|uniref:Molecular chaperone n=2 Tax=Pseudonocardiaceae TaxID=2070 RepID=A0AAC9PUH3_9PSEU|nr:molecular chaperone [Actinoalloteichus fjordicus]APU23189.1 molecular chaperone [Actinoalloteichus sp. GBA129-24]
MDAVDVAVADLAVADETVSLQPLGGLGVPYPVDLRRDLMTVVQEGDCSARLLCELDTRIGQTFAEAALRAIDEYGGGRADLVASLGQTVYHWIEPGAAGSAGSCLGTLQLGSPAWIAEAVGLPVVDDLRTRDVAAGGHGAPLAGLFDRYWIAGLVRAEPEDHTPIGVLNLGGIANLTVADGAATIAYDVGPANALLDAACTELDPAGPGFDVGGRLAARGRPDSDLLGELLADPFYSAAPPKSTGKEHFNGAYLRGLLAGRPAIAPPDLLATLVELTAATIGAAVRGHGLSRVVVSGGGARNPTLLRALRARLTPAQLTPSDLLGVPGDDKEAYLTTLLGFLTWHGLPGNLPSATGAAGPRVLGSITPGAGPLRQPPPSAAAVRALRIDHVRDRPDLGPAAAAH